MYTLSNESSCIILNKCCWQKLRVDLDYDTLIITELTDFKNTHFYVLPLLSQRPK